MTSESRRVLFLDDSETRHDTFEDQDGGRSVIDHVFSASHALEHLGKIVSLHYDVACLDHDLSEEDIMCPPGGPSRVPTGMGVVDHIVSMPEQLRPRFVIVHTHNQPAGLEMMYRLKGAGVPCSYWPFANLINAMRVGGGLGAIPGVR